MFALLASACSGDEASDATNIGVTVTTETVSVAPNRDEPGDGANVSVTPPIATVPTTTVVTTEAVETSLTVIEAQPVYLEETAIGGLGSGLGATYDRIVSNYLKNTATLEEVAEVFEIAEPVEVPLTQLFGGWENPPPEILEHLTAAAALEASGYDNSEEAHELSLAAIARYYSSLYLGLTTCGLGGCFEDTLLPPWWRHAMDVRDDSYGDYVFSLDGDIKDHFFYSRVYPLIQLYDLGFHSLYCFETIGMDVEGLAGTLLLDVANDFDLWNTGVYAHDEVVRRGESIGFSKAELLEARDNCGGEHTVWLFPIPFDMAQAHQLLQEYFLEFLQEWIVENQDDQPLTLTIVDSNLEHAAADSELTEPLVKEQDVSVSEPGADLAAASGGAVENEELRATAGRFLRGESSIAEISSLARLPLPAEGEYEFSRHRKSWVFAYGAESSDDFAQYHWAERASDEADRQRDLVELRLEQLADTQAAIFALADRLDIKESLTPLYVPEWFSPWWYEYGSPFKEYRDSLRAALAVYEWPLSIQQLQEVYWLYDEVHCLESLGIVTDGLLQRGFEEAAATVAAGEPSSVTHTGMAAQLFNLSGAPSSMRIPYGKCLLRSDERLWPLPYDPQEAFELLRGDVLAYLQQWAEENRDLQPEGLTVILPQG